MPPRKSLTNQPHRVVCMCTAYECRDQEYSDSNGVNHPGVEVLPETKAAHERADFRENFGKTSHSPSHLDPHSLGTAHDNLLLPLRQLHIASAPHSLNNSQSADHHKRPEPLAPKIDDRIPQLKNPNSVSQLELPTKNLVAGG